jgi:Ca2+-binding RTX toxin-like protein
MAIVTLSQPASLPDLNVWVGEVFERTATRIVVSDTTQTAVYTGNFTFSNAGVSGTLNSFTYRIGTETQFTVTGIGADAAAVFNAIDVQQDAVLAASLILAKDDVITGSSGADNLRGFDGDDVMTGRGGNDTLRGGDDKDTITGGDGRDSLSGGGSGDVISGGADADKITGGTGNDVLAGGSGNDSVYGDDGRDTVSGGSGDDTLTGGASADTFLFSGNLDTMGRDLIVDFRSNDLIGLSRTTFTELGSTITRGEFRIGSTAQDDNDRLLFNDQTGVLRYDADAEGGDRAVVIALVVDVATLSYDDFVLV